MSIFVYVSYSAFVFTGVSLYQTNTQATIFISKQAKRKHTEREKKTKKQNIDESQSHVEKTENIDKSQSHVEKKTEQNIDKSHFTLLLKVTHTRSFP